MKSDSQSAICTVRNVTKVYRAGSVTVRALDGVSLKLFEGQIVAIMGRSGSGKSTLLRQLGLLDRPTSGYADLYGNAVTTLSERERSRLRLKYVGYVFQEYALLAELTAIQNVFLPAMMEGRSSNQYRSEAKRLLASVGLESRVNHYPKELSGGEQQRVAIARAMINSPKLLLADEPCANLDSTSSLLVMNTLVTLNRETMVTIVFVSHDNADKRYADTWLFLKDGRISSEE